MLHFALNCFFKHQLPSLTTSSPLQGKASHLSRSSHLWVMPALPFSPLVLPCEYLTAYCSPHLPGLSVPENSWPLPSDKRTNLITSWTPYAHRIFLVRTETYITCFIVQMHERWKSDYGHAWINYFTVTYGTHGVELHHAVSCSCIQGKRSQQNEDISAPLWGFTCSCWYYTWFASHARWNLKSL